ncbi:RNA polymerase subunit sigma-70 [Streptomyces sp. MST-110588]|uniref:RNA polymerase subunit sigma-70 n=1 Tax=Streptomyces sp. MST-110588 TaxID=2833628 RepID=UPI001F5DD897|nr:RNA polymerase subunit sigma-70 [Streptomyces sp. MST-110588]UNO39304.1 RNA polymerase subunit sigma-70 [Streptomyces sp. MST-110588]
MTVTRPGTGGGRETEKEKEHRTAAVRTAPAATYEVPREATHKVPHEATHKVPHEAAFAELAERHRHELRVHCYRLLGSFTDAEDMVQETLLRAWRRRETFEGRATFRAWLYRIATNVCLDALADPARKREVRTATDSAGRPARARAATAEVTWLEPYPDRLLDLAAPDDAGPEAAAITRETVELAFLAAVQHLPPRQRAVLILRDVVGQPAQETAEALEMSVPSVKSALQRARATLREQLPERRTDWRRATTADETERALLQRYITASRQSDLTALAALLREDIRQTMPPAHLVFDGRRAVLDMWRAALEDQQTWGDWFAVPLAANRQPAVANYVRRPGESHCTAINIDVLCVQGGLITEITTFGPELLPAFGLEPTAAPETLTL